MKGVKCSPAPDDVGCELFKRRIRLVSYVGTRGDSWTWVEFKVVKRPQVRVGYVELMEVAVLSCPGFYFTL